MRMLVGPTVVAGAASGDPMFVDPAFGDYHLTAFSPVIDKVDAGPALRSTLTAMSGPKERVLISGQTNTDRSWRLRPRPLCSLLDGRYFDRMR